MYIQIHMIPAVRKSEIWVTILSVDGISFLDRTGGLRDPLTTEESDELFIPFGNEQELADAFELIQRCGMGALYNTRGLQDKCEMCIHQLSCIAFNHALHRA